MINSLRLYSFAFVLCVEGRREEESENICTFFNNFLLSDKLLFWLIPNMKPIRRNTGTADLITNVFTDFVFVILINVKTD